MTDDVWVPPDKRPPVLVRELLPYETGLICEFGSCEEWATHELVDSPEYTFLCALHATGQGALQAENAALRTLLQDAYTLLDTTFSEQGRTDYGALSAWFPRARAALGIALEGER